MSGQSNPLVFSSGEGRHTPAKLHVIQPYFLEKEKSFTDFRQDVASDVPFSAFQLNSIKEVQGVFYDQARKGIYVGCFFMKIISSIITTNVYADETDRMKDALMLFLLPILFTV